MNKDVIIISNNPRVAEKLQAFEREACDTYEQVLCRVRDKIHIGASLLTHPLAGSVKPGESPYRSVAVREGGDELDLRSLEIIESALDRFRIMTAHPSQKEYTPAILDDFQLIDYNLLLTGLESILSTSGGRANYDR